MKFFIPSAFAAAFILSSIGVVSAQSLRNSSGVVELPPAGYSGKQYVDSKGCIYIRAGQAGNVTWVPRVTRDRRQVCGYKPSLAATGVVVRVASIPTPKPKTRSVRNVPVVKLTPTVIPNAPKIKAPRGYRTAWVDGRLNQGRGGKTQTGQQQMEMVWTNTVPRRLVPKN